MDGEVYETIASILPSHACIRERERLRKRERLISSSGRLKLCHVYGSQRIECNIRHPCWEN